MTIDSSHGPRRTFLIECYAAGLDAGHVAEASARARRACADLRARGRPVEYLGSLHVPADEEVFHLFGASDVALARDAARLAGLEAGRVVESVVVAAVDGWAPVGAGGGASPGQPRR